METSLLQRSMLTGGGGCEEGDRLAFRIIKKGENRGVRERRRDFPLKAQTCSDCSISNWSAVRERWLLKAG